MLRDLQTFPTVFRLLSTSGSRLFCLVCSHQSDPGAGSLYAHPTQVQGTEGRGSKGVDLQEGNERAVISFTVSPSKAACFISPKSSSCCATVQPSQPPPRLHPMLPKLLAQKKSILRKGFPMSQ